MPGRNVPDRSAMVSGSDSGSLTKSPTDTTLGTPSTNAMVGAVVHTGPALAGVAVGVDPVDGAVGADCAAGAIVVAAESDPAAPDWFGRAAVVSCLEAPPKQPDNCVPPSATD